MNIMYFMYANIDIWNHGIFFYISDNLHVHV